MSVSKEHPILFSEPMVRAILEGRKTQTRRIVKPQPASHLLDGEWLPPKCPYGGLGDRLWVRETFGYCSGVGLTSNTADATYVCFRDGSQVFKKDRSYHQWTKPVNDSAWPSDWKWRPSIHMPRWASRITLEVTGVRVERLQDISEEDAVAEGLEPRDWCGPSQFHLANGCTVYGQSVHCFKKLWESINGLNSWDANPWVWVVEFRRLANA